VLGRVSGQALNVKCGERQAGSGGMGRASRLFTALNFAAILPNWCGIFRRCFFVLISIFLAKFVGVIDVPVCHYAQLLRNAAGAFLLLCLSGCSSGQADTSPQATAMLPADERLVELRDGLIALRADQSPTNGVKDAGAALMAAKRQLHLWTESGIQTLDQYADRDIFIRGLNEQLGPVLN